MQELIDFAAHKLPLPRCATRKQRDERSRQMLLRVLGLGTTVAVVGSGMSIPFGYPSWQDLAIEVLRFTLNSLKPGSGDYSEIVSLLKEARGQERLGQNELMFLIGACKRILQQNGLEKSYHMTLRELFERGENPMARNAFGPLLELPIQRFVTTNYDCEIERALINTRHLPAAEFGLREKDLLGQQPACRSCSRSFTQRADSLHHLALFAMGGIPGNENKFFHCHGRFDDPETIVATEEDYQYWYLGKQEGASLAFQQSFELLLGSNPLLFIGYGLRDEDLLRPLRELVALDPKRKGARPIFALLETPIGSDPFYHDALFDRFGLHVIPFPSLGERPEQRTESLCLVLKQLKKEGGSPDPQQPRPRRGRRLSRADRQRADLGRAPALSTRRSGEGAP